MKYNNKSKMIFIFLIMILCYLNVSGNEIKLIKIAVNNAPPYRIVSENQFNGIYIKIAEKIFENIEGYKYEFVDVPFKRALEMMKEGNVDMMLGPNKTKEREGYMFFFETYLPADSKVFLIRIESNEIEKYEDLYNKRVSVLRGANYFEPFNSDENIKKEYVNNYVQALKKLEYNRTDVVIIPEKQADYYLEKENYKIKKSKLIIKGDISFFAFSKKSKNMEIIPILENELKKIDFNYYFSEEFIKKIVEEEEKNKK